MKYNQYDNHFSLFGGILQLSKHDLVMETQDMNGWSWKMQEFSQIVRLLMVLLNQPTILEGYSFSNNHGEVEND